MKSKSSLKEVLIVALLFASIGLHAQVKTVGTYKNLITVKESRSDLEGSPYLYPEWEEATVKFSAGINPLTENVKYDLLEDIVVAKGANDEEYSFNDMPTEFVLTNSKEIYRNGFPPMDSMTEKTFYQVIYDGKVKFLKKLSKTVIESKGYASASVTKKVSETINYYVLTKDKKFLKVKNNEKSIIAALGNGDALGKFINDNKIDLKSNDGIIKLLTFYDGL
ncbi:hypothetical protein [Pedobacter mendelii]|uniref:Uncharacterized protein n=1 Tax=Pedobacter mendelii TaxID=1908240 RepID=A0ABQ2BLE7_9SPHI|nr:hypothetical protein [Pedobacter mendelii]GGI28942.1 hypothetical protein GCM10008119_35160 [Pedobacter mendelii]